MLEDRARCTQAGMDGYLTKPFSFQELQAAIATVAAPPHPAIEAVPLAGAIVE